MKKSAFAWDMTEIEAFFKAIDLPAGPVRLDEGTLITDVSLFVESHLAIVRAHNGCKVYEPYYERLNNFIKLMR